MKLRITVECISEDKTRKSIIQESTIKKPETVLDLGFRHTEQIEILRFKENSFC